MIRTAENVFILPYLIHLKLGWVGGIEPSFLVPEARIRHRHGFVDNFPAGLDTDKTSAMHLTGRYLFGGPLYNHFGHIMTDSIHRLWAYGHETSTDKIVFVAAAPEKARINRTHVSAELLDVLSLFGISTEKLHIIKEPTVVEELVFAPPGSAYLAGPEPWYLEFLSALQTKIINLLVDSKIAYPEKLLFGRTHMIHKGHKGTVMGESYFTHLLEASGFSYIRPEEYGIIEQCGFLLNADQIVFAEGAAILSAELLRKVDARLFMIPRRTGPCVFIPHLKQKSNFCILGGQDNLVRLPDARGRNDPNSPSFFLAPDRVHRDLSSNRLIGDEKFNCEKFRSFEKRDFSTYSCGREPYFSTTLARAYRAYKETLSIGNRRGDQARLAEITSRIGRLQRLAVVNSTSSYLEIGVHQGTTFNSLDFHTKVAVDPKFRFAYKKHKTDRILFFEETSDSFFQNDRAHGIKFDLIYLDGLHVFEQTLRDFCSSIAYAHDKTIWLLESTVPLNAAQADPSQERAVRLRPLLGDNSRSWMGDVYKVVFAIYDFFPQYSIATFPGHGQTVVWRETRRDIKPILNSMQKISGMSYLDFLEIKEVALNLMGYDDLLARVEYWLTSV